MRELVVFIKQINKYAQHNDIKDLKYRLVEKFELQTEIIPAEPIVSHFSSLTKDGFLTMEKSSLLTSKPNSDTESRQVALCGLLMSLSRRAFWTLQKRVWAFTRSRPCMGLANAGRITGHLCFDRQRDRSEVLSVDFARAISSGRRRKEKSQLLLMRTTGL